MGGMVRQVSVDCCGRGSSGLVPKDRGRERWGVVYGETGIGRASVCKDERGLGKRLPWPRVVRART